MYRIYYDNIIDIYNIIYNISCILRNPSGGGLPVVLGGTMFRSAQFGFYEAALGTENG